MHLLHAQPSRPRDRTKQSVTNRTLNDEALSPLYDIRRPSLTRKGKGRWNCFEGSTPRLRGICCARGMAKAAHDRRGGCNDLRQMCVFPRGSVLRSSRGTV